MDFLENLFKQHPFIYCIDEKYYVFGTGVCVQTDCDIAKKRYSWYVEAIADSNIQSDKAAYIFRNVVSVASTIQGEKGYATSILLENFENFNFNADQLKTLQLQVEYYVKFYQKHSIYKYYSN